MYQVIIVVHVLLGLGVVSLVLMQQGKGADAGAAFSGGSGSVFGAQGASSFLSRSTAILALLFFSTSLGLAVLSGYQSKADDIMDTPVIEKPIADVPLIGDNQEVVPVADKAVVNVNDTPIIETATDSVPVIKESTDVVVPAVDGASVPSADNKEDVTPLVTEDANKTEIKATEDKTTDTTDKPTTDVVTDDASATKPIVADSIESNAQ